MADQFSWSGFLLRLLAARVVVVGTNNAEWFSWYHWRLAPLASDVGSFNALKFLAGILLIVAWVVCLRAARRSIGIMGAILITAVCGGVIWLLIDYNVVRAGSTKGITRVVLFAVSI